MSENLHQKAVLELITKDRKIKEAVKRYGMPEDRKLEGGFESLFRMIVGQQISVKAANSVWGKLKDIKVNSVKNLLLSDSKKLNAAGLSKQKISYCKDLAEKIQNGSLNLNELTELSSDEVHRKLTSIKGIGDWTADIYQLFVLCDMSVFPQNDIAIQEGARIFFDLKKRPKPVELIEMSQQWSPLRGAAALVLWQIYRREIHEGSSFSSKD